MKLKVLKLSVGFKLKGYEKFISYTLTVSSHRNLFIIFWLYIFNFNIVGPKV